MQSAYCRDAKANAAARWAARAVVEICAPFGPIPLAPSREQVLSAFRELPLYKGAIRTDPAAFTLVNLETYFWCGDADGRGCEAIGEAEQRVTLLGQPIRIRPKIVSYRWSFGDGAQQISAGTAAHTYRHPGRVTVTLTLTWTADYALGTGGSNRSMTPPPRPAHPRAAGTRSPDRHRRRRRDCPTDGVTGPDTPSLLGGKDQQ